MHRRNHHAPSPVECRRPYARPPGSGESEPTLARTFEMAERLLGPLKLHVPIPLLPALVRREVAARAQAPRLVAEASHHRTDVLGEVTGPVREDVGSTPVVDVV